MFNILALSPVFRPSGLYEEYVLCRNHILVSIHLKMSMINKIFIVYQHRIGHRNVILHHFQQYFSYIVAVSFIGGGNRREPPICCKSLTNLIT